MCSTKSAEFSQVPEFLSHARQLEKRPPCQAHCPNTGEIRGWIGMIAQHDKNGMSLPEAYDAAWLKLAERNPLPASVSRICPHPCEDQCSRNDKDGAVSINSLERFLGDWGLERSLSLPLVDAESWSESIGAVGSGPASLSFAYQMARRGYEVTMYERRLMPGGMLRHAIPDYRLPKDVLDAEIDRLLRLNIVLERDVDVGNAVDLAALRDKHALIFLGVGAQSARKLDIPGESGPGVLSGIEFLQRRQEQRMPMQGQHVIVIGGGNTAIDAARGALRDGASVTIVYRRSEAEMPASASEVDDARTEGVEFRFLLAPTEILRDGDRVRYVRMQPMRLGDPDDQGRRRPEPLDEAPQELAADLVIGAAAQAPDWHGMEGVVAATKWAGADPHGRLADGIWVGGDDRGPGIASAAIAHGRLAAEAAHAELRDLPQPVADARRAVDTGSLNADFFKPEERGTRPRRPQDEWLMETEAEIDQTLDSEQALQEAARCMSCGLCFDCQQCFMYCNAAGFTRIEQTGPGKYYALALDACEGCGKCIEICPCGYLEVREDG
jgi:formate dehydrogenase major subunit